MTRRRVVVTGLGVVAPNGIGVDAYWDALMAGRSGVGPITAFDASRFKSRIAGEIKDFDPERYRGAWVARDAEPTIRMEVSPRAARWFEDYYPVENATTMSDGWRAVELVSSGDAWAATLMLRLGADARAVEPESVVKEARALAGRIAKRYGT